MKEATGELNMTVVTILIIAALAVIGGSVVVPAISGAIRNSSCKTMFGADAANNVRAKKFGSDWYCCPSGSSAQDDCQLLEQ